MTRMGGAAWSSMIAVAGTLLGAAATYLFQKQNTERMEATARTQARRNERLAAYETYAGAMVDYRRGEYDRAHTQLGRQPLSYVHPDVQDDYYRLRSAAQHALLRIRLICDETAVVAAAEHAYNVAGTIHDADNADGIRAAGEHARSALDQFIQAANASVR